MLGSFNAYQKDVGIMQKEGDIWWIDVEPHVGENYYKFLINDELELNDPYANIYFPNKDEELWSVMLIDKNGDRLYNPAEYVINLEDYAISTVVTEENIPVNKKNFNKKIDKKVVARFGFHGVTGAHEVTCLWYNPMGQLVEYAQNIIVEDTEAFYTWFWFDILEAHQAGVWRLQLFIDGNFVLEDQFSICEAYIYTVNGYR